MRDLESSLQQFGEFLLKARLASDKAAPFLVRWVRGFLSAPASDEPLADQTRRFCEELERDGRYEDWQIRQAEHAIRLYFVNYLHRTDWQTHAPAATDLHGRTAPSRAIELLRQRLRTRHYSYRTERTYVDWARRFFEYAENGVTTPGSKIGPDTVRDFLTHLAVRRHVSASTQNQALSALLLLAREVLGFDVDLLASCARARPGHHLPVVLSVPETIALLRAMHGTSRLMAELIYGGGLRVSECCQLRVKDLDFDQGLIFVRSGKGDKDRSTLLANAASEGLREQVRAAETLHRKDCQAGLAGVWLPDALERKDPRAGLELGWFWVFPSQTLSVHPRAGLVRRHHAERLRRPESGEDRGPGGGHPQARVRSQPSALLRDAPSAQRGGHPSDPGLSGTRQGRDDDDLHARRQGAPVRRRVALDAPQDRNGA